MSSRLAGVSSTDLIGGGLMADFDNGRVEDLFVTNGIRRECQQQGFLCKI